MPKFRPVALLFALLLFALLVRLYQINSLSNDFHAIRQYNSALIVRPEFLKLQSNVPPWRLDNALLNQPKLLEPPLLQLAALAGYLLTGEEHLWIPRMISAVFWVIGGYFVYRVSKQLGCSDGASLIAAAFYLFAPFGILASRSFQPNPIMISLMVISIFTLLRYFEEPSRRSLIWAILATGTAVFVLPLAAFIIFPLLAWLAVQKFGWRGALTNRPLISLVITSLLPTSVYYLLGLFVAGFMAGQTNTLFIPRLWLTAEYWANWLVKIIEVVGLIPLLLSIQTLLTLRRRKQVGILRCLWGAYFVFGLLVSYPIYTHNYYSLPLIPIAGLTIGCMADQVVSWLPKRQTRLGNAFIVIAGLIIVIAGLAQYLPTTIVTDKQVRAVETARDISGKLNHSPSVIFLTDDYGSHLLYYGEIAGMGWPTYNSLKFLNIAGREPMSVGERLQQVMSGRDYRYFVVTSGLELNLQPDLAQYLKDHYPVLAQSDDYIIYELSA